MDNATRKELLYKARAAGYPGSILDVFAGYEQGKDLVAEFQQQQQLQQLQQQQMPAQSMQPQQQMQAPQIPVVPSSPTPAPKFTPPQPAPPIGVQSQQTQMGLVSGQSGPNQGRAIFKTGGFKYDEGGPINPNFQYSYDTSKSFAENQELNRRAQVAGWNSVGQYEKSGWGYNTVKQKQQELINNPEAQKFAKPVENKDQLYANRTSGAQKAVNQAYYTLSNPVEAAGHAMKYGYVPQGNLGNYGHRGDGDAFATTINDFVNPFAWGNAAYRLSNEVGNKKSWTTKEGLATMGTDALEALPFFGTIASKAAPIISRVAKPLEESYDVGKQLSKIKAEGIRAGKNEFEIAKEQLEKVGITSNQRRGYTPGVSEVLNKYVMPLGYEGEAGTSKLAQTLENIGYGGWEKRLRSSDVEVFSPEKIKMRADAWRMYLGMPQQHGTFRMANTAPAMHPSYKPGSLKGMDIYSIPEEKVFTRSSNFRESNPSGDNFIKPLDNPIILDRDANIMGGYNKVLSKDGLQYNDIWDLEPTISYNRLVPEKIKKMLPEKVNQKLFYKEVPINTANHPLSNNFLTLQQPRGIKIPVSKFVGKPFMSHGNLNYTSADYILDAQKHLTDRLNIVAPEGSSSQILRGHPSTDVRFNKAVKIEEQLKKLNSGEYPKYKKGGPVCYTCVGRKRRV